MRNPTVAVIGLGYVGLPLAVEFAKHFRTLGYDIDQSRVDQLAAGTDRTLEVTPDELSAATHLELTCAAADLQQADVFVVTVPTPIDKHKRPDLGPLEAASRTVGRAMGSGATIIYESTVFPGATEEVCIPILETESGLRLNEGFTVGYSPERINPGDRRRRLPDIVKVTSGSTPDAAAFIDDLYSRIVRAGTFRASSIRVAEAAKVIENTQRDVNIALVNELAILFGKLGIDTQDVLAAAGTKWNFLPFRPGLVGGHCIGVDPYYLTHKAEEIGHHPQMILAGRRINDGMGEYIAEQVVLLMAQRGMPIGGSRALLLGLTFKENVPDLRNTRVVDVVRRLQQFGIEVDVTDPWADDEEALREYGLELIALSECRQRYPVIILAVNHREFLDDPSLIEELAAPGAVVYDVKGALPAGLASARL
jgi:UDP-N-acetyl-D-galactosamine dehydrogenase